MSRLRTHYDNLKVARDAPPEIIESAYRVLARKYHPDFNVGKDANRIMTIINAAYEVLSDPAKRRTHDEWIRQMEGATPENGISPGLGIMALTRRAFATMKWRSPNSAATTLWQSVAVLAIITAAIVAIIYISPTDHRLQNQDLTDSRQSNSAAEFDHAIASSSDLTNYDSPKQSTLQSDAPNQPTLLPDPQPLPRTGVMWTLHHSQSPNWPRLSIKSGSTTGNVYAKVLEADTNQQAARLFIRRNERVMVRLAPGEYKIRYVAGSDWYGESLQFGSESAFELAKTFNLWTSNRQYMVEEIELIPQVNGNLEYHEIPLNSF